MPAMLASPSGGSPSTAATSGAKMPVGMPHPPGPVLASPGVGHTYPVFYPAPPYLPQYITPPSRPELKEDIK